MQKNLLVLLVLTTSAGTASVATASAPFGDDGASFYVGGSVGRSYIELDAVDVFRDIDDGQTGYRFFLGGKLNNLIGLEAAFTDFGSVTAEPNIGTFSASAETDGLSVAATLELPLGDDFSLFAKGGMLWWQADFDSVVPAMEDNDLFFGLGARYRINDNVALIGEYDRYDIDTLDTDFLSLGVSVGF